MTHVAWDNAKWNTTRVTGTKGVQFIVGIVLYCAPNAFILDQLVLETGLFVMYQETLKFYFFILHEEELLDTQNF